jgi:hypothetical protein
MACLPLATAVVLLDIQLPSHAFSSALVGSAAFTGALWLVDQCMRFFASFISIRETDITN